MKKAKRILSALLTLALALALALTLALPAAAAVNWDDFRITKQPQNLTIKSGDSFTLSVEVNVPAGVVVEYQWRFIPGGREPIEGATGSELSLAPGDRYYPSQDGLDDVRVGYECVINAYEKDSGGNIISSRNKWSDTAYVSLERKALRKLLDVTIAPFGYAFTMVVSSPALALIFPISYLGCLIYSYIIGFRALFS